MKTLQKGVKVSRKHDTPKSPTNPVISRLQGVFVSSSLLSLLFISNSLIELQGSFYIFFRLKTSVKTLNFSSGHYELF